MPLETAVAAFGHERGGWMRRRSREMANQLLRGVPLPMAIKEAPGVLPPEAIPLTCVGHDTGVLPEAIDRAIAGAIFSNLCGNRSYRKSAMSVFCHRWPFALLPSSC